MMPPPMMTTSAWEGSLLMMFYISRDSRGAAMQARRPSCCRPPRILARRDAGFTSGFLAPCQPRLDVFDAGHDVGDAVDHIVGACLAQPPDGTLAQPRLFRLGKLLPGLEGQPHFVAADGKPDGPHARIESFLDPRAGVVDLDAGLDRRDPEVDDVLQAHVGIGTARRHFRGADRGIGL